MRLFLIGAATLALTACGGAPSENTAAPAEVVANAANAMNEAGANTAAVIAGLPQNQRDGVLFRAIRDAGLPCQDILKSEQTEPTQGKPTWRAQCEDENYHLIVVNPDGTAQVISRTTP